ncbi:hypothetical protein [Mycolicibacterium mageritense]|uniref:hypothetical protein n=1 Tax=Mycolicibacterium mageritense TaxID=53462 RepID=UPI001E44C1D8|nr:hypothetical protein [Mycolicibacterium mageritense]GJJ20794.1 hypothetical protein MTY414_44670 [Mycolicibacterium mageritense]
MALLDDIVNAAGGLDRWQAGQQVLGTLESSGSLFEIKKMPGRSKREIAVAMRDVWAAVWPAGETSHVEFTADGTALVSEDGTELSRRRNVRDTFAGHVLESPWNPLQRGYFSGYALWNYLNLPFLLTLPGVHTHAIEPIGSGGRRLVGLGATLPAGLPSHCRHQQFFFGPDLLLARHGYHLDIAGRIPVIQYVEDYVDVDGLKIPTIRRAYLRDDLWQPRSQLPLVSLRFTGLRVTSRDPAIAVRNP